MSYFKVIKQGKGDGAGRVRYLLLHSDGEPVKVYSNIVEDLFLYANENLQDENYRRKLANRFNQILKYRQNDYKTKHLVVSFSHLLDDEELEKAVNIIEETLAYKISDTAYMIVVHREPNNRTAFHIVVSRNSQNKLIDFNQKEFYLTKKELAENLKNAGLMNELEIKAYNNLKENKAKENKVKGQDIKNRVKDIASKIMEHLENGRIKNAKALINYYSFKVELYRAGEKSPVKNETLKRDRLYVSAVIKDKKEKKYKRIYIRADKHLKSFFSKYIDIHNKLAELEEIKQINKKAEQKAEIKNIPDLSVSVPSIPKMPRTVLKVEKTQQEQSKAKYKHIKRDIENNLKALIEKKRKLDNELTKKKLRRLNNIHIFRKIAEEEKIKVAKPNMFELQDIKGVENDRKREERRIFTAYRQLQTAIDRIRTVDRRSREVERRKISIRTVEPATIQELKCISINIQRAKEFSRNELSRNRQSIERHRRNIEQFRVRLADLERKEQRIVRLFTTEKKKAEPKKNEKIIKLNVYSNNDTEKGFER